MEAISPRDVGARPDAIVTHWWTNLMLLRLRWRAKLLLPMTIITLLLSGNESLLGQIGSVIMNGIDISMQAFHLFLPQFLHFITLLHTIG